MKVGEIVVFIEDFEFNGKLYKKGHQFTIVGSASGMPWRGWDLEDKDGNCIGETISISNMYVSLSDERNRKINDIIE